MLAEKENLSLYGFPNGTWEVRVPDEDIPPEMPEPVLGINFSKALEKKHWLTVLAAHTDAWLMSFAFFLGTYRGFDREARARLFRMINELPSITDIVTGADRKPKKDKTPKSCSKRKRSSPEPSRQSERISSKHASPLEYEDGEGEGCASAECGLCGDCVGIRCDVCGQWFHAECLKVTVTRDECVTKLTCRSCVRNKRVRFS